MTTKPTPRDNGAKALAERLTMLYSRPHEAQRDAEAILANGSAFVDAGELERLREELPRLRAMRTWPRGSNGSVAIAAYEALVWRLWGLLTKGTAEYDDDPVTGELRSRATLTEQEPKP